MANNGFATFSNEHFPQADQWNQETLTIQYQQQRFTANNSEYF